MAIPPQMVRREQALPSVDASGVTGTDIQERIRTLEARLDRMLEQVPDAESAEDWDSSGPRKESKTPPKSPLESIRESEYYRRHWGRSGLQQPGQKVDDFGFDPEWERKFVNPLMDFLFTRWFRVEVSGIENVPARGRCVVVANHSGTLPLDGPILRAAFRKQHPAARDLRWLAEDFLYFLPFAGTYITRSGAVRACQENAERLLENERLVAAFPEGMKGISKHRADKYRLLRFGRGGFIRLCLRTRTPLVPCAVVGAEETAPILYRDEILAKWLGLPYLPITATFPWLGPLGLIPAPTKWRLVFGEVMRFDEYGPADAEDDVLVSRLTERVRANVQRMLDTAVRERKSIWFG